MNDTILTTLLPPSPQRPHITLPSEVVQGRAIRNTYIWVLVGVGLPGNLACLVTILSMHVTTATLYVALLAVVDTVALLLKLLFHQLVSHSKMTPQACIFYLSSSFFSCYANWVLALICFERFFACCFPLKKQAYFTKRRAYISVIIMTAALAICYGPTPAFYVDTDRANKDCIVRESLKDFKTDFYDMFNICLYFFIPFVLIAVFTTLIIIGLQRHRQARERMSMARTGGGGSGGNEGNVERSISIMLLSAALVFLVLTLPACLYYLFLKDYFDPTVMKESAQGWLFYQVITMLSDITHAVNFIIYFLTAAKFRKRFMELCKRCLCLAPCRSYLAQSSSDDATILTQVSHTQEAALTQEAKRSSMPTSTA